MLHLQDCSGIASRCGVAPSWIGEAALPNLHHLQAGRLPSAWRVCDGLEDADVLVQVEHAEEAGARDGVAHERPSEEDQAATLHLHVEVDGAPRALASGRRERALRDEVARGAEQLGVVPHACCAHIEGLPGDVRSQREEPLCPSPERAPAARVAGAPEAAAEQPAV
eukprot:CAMPEP_0195605130 /NCGR_PEP_ID=MMETSP0815-20121206/6997_1 /TAXON_ID=97485 /ORGANISM="Prymnesium parvum, Strain Texoma1" /LENGTH=166 /DNA_ID=CAMNT_0040744803 /DNA_START=193 /DNA_END=690 /DNA_ORIENTATION=-